VYYYPAYYYPVDSCAVAAAPVKVKVRVVIDPKAEPKKEPPPMPPAEDSTEDNTTASKAAVLVKAPEDVVLTVNGQRATRTSTEETYYTPKLKPGRTYEYVFKASAMRDGEKLIRVRRVEVRAGQQTDVDFSDMASRTERTSARVTVLASSATQLTVNGVAVGKVSAKRTFLTPKLQAGRTYTYIIKAKVKADGRTRTIRRTVDVAAGKTVTVDLRAEAIASR
jgi:uncharacterized protein (TIGR03000 family)